MLGMGVGARVAHDCRDLIDSSNIIPVISWSCIGCAVSIPAALLLICLVPILPFTSEDSVMSLAGLVVLIVASTIPFFLSGTAISLAITSGIAPAGRIYGFDLLGAAVGCLFVAIGLTYIDAPSLVLICGAAAALSAILYNALNSSAARKMISSVLFVSLVAAGLANNGSKAGIRLVAVKGKVESLEGASEKWNSFSRVLIGQLTESPFEYYGAGLSAPRPIVRSRIMTIDGDAATTAVEFGSAGDLESLRYDITNFAYHLGPTGKACIIGVGGGRDLQSALLFGHAKVTGIDVNPIFIDLLSEQLKSAPPLPGNPEVHLVAQDARTYLSHISDYFDIIQMTLIDTWAANGAGAFSLTENSLYTFEAWRTFLNRLTSDGIFTVSRWHRVTDLGETGRAVSLAVAAVLASGNSNASQHIAMVTTSRISTILIKKSPFTMEEITKIHEKADSLGFALTILPGRPPTHEVLQKIISARSLDELAVVSYSSIYNFSPPTDDSPYFFNMLRLGSLWRTFDSSQGVISGNVQATSMLVCLLIVISIIAFAALLGPFVPGSKDGAAAPALFQAAAYFVLIGLGFMFVEISLLQRLSLFLGHPVYALSVVLFSLILSAGCGSFMSARPFILRNMSLWPILTFCMLLLANYTLPRIIASSIAMTMNAKVFISVGILLPLGFLLGLFFPLGLSTFGKRFPSQRTWFWALNAFFGVCASVAAVFIGIYAGINVSLTIAACCYGLLFFCINDRRFTVMAQLENSVKRVFKRNY